MILLDSNVLLYCVNSSALHHTQAKQHLQSLLSGNETVAFPWIVLLAFLRISTKRGIFRSPLETKEALEIVSSWIGQANVVLLSPGPKHFQILSGLLTEVGVCGDLTSDAHLAAIAIECKAELHSFDSDFERFPGLRMRLLPN